VVRFGVGVALPASTAPAVNLVLAIRQLQSSIGQLGLVILVPHVVRPGFGRLRISMPTVICTQVLVQARRTCAREHEAGCRGCGNWLVQLRVQSHGRDRRFIVTGRAGNQGLQRVAIVGSSIDIFVCSDMSTCWPVEKCKIRAHTWTSNEAGFNTARTWQKPVIRRFELAGALVAWQRGNEYAALHYLQRRSRTHSTLLPSVVWNRMTVCRVARLIAVAMARKEEAAIGRLWALGPTKRFGFCSVVCALGGTSGLQPPPDRRG
jgi:hypothetical protein